MQATYAGNCIQAPKKRIQIYCYLRMALIGIKSGHMHLSDEVQYVLKIFSISIITQGKNHIFRPNILWCILGPRLLFPSALGTHL